MTAPAVGERVPQATFADMYRRLRIGQKVGSASQSGDVNSSGSIAMIASFTAALNAGDVVELNYQGAYRCSAAAAWGELTIRAAKALIATSGDAIATDGQADMHCQPTTAGLLTPIRWAAEYTAATADTYVFSVWIIRKSASGTFTMDEANGNTGRFWGKVTDVAA